MRDLSPAALICAVLSGLLGLSHLFYPWNPPLQKWKSCAGAARRTLLLLAFYFTAYLVAIFIIFFEVTSQLVPRLLFELCWLNGLCVEVRITLFRNTTANRKPGRLSTKTLFNTLRNPCIVHTSYTGSNYRCGGWLTSVRWLCDLDL